MIVFSVVFIDRSTVPFHRMHVAHGSVSYHWCKRSLT